MSVTKSNGELLAPELFGDPGLNVFAILDGASVPGMVQTLHRLAPEFECLYRGHLEPDIAMVAPYLVKLQADTEFTDMVLNQGWGNHWGVFALTSADLFAMRQHLRRFLTVHDSTGKPLLFRYYDPRVLRVYLPTCNADEIGAFFGPITRYFMEGEKPDIGVWFHHKSGALVEKKKELKEA